MPITVTCPNCRESLEIPNNLLGGDVRCGSCLEVFLAVAADGRETPPPLPTDEPPPRPRRKNTNVPRNKPVPTSRPDDDYGPIEFDPDRKRKQGVGPAVWILLAVFGFLGCACCGGIGWFTFQMMDPEYKRFEPPDKKFVAEFPAEVKQKSRETGRKAGETVVSFEADRRMVRETYFIYFVELTADEKKDPQGTLDKLCTGLEKITKGVARGRHQQVHQGFDAAEVTIRQGKRFTKARAIIADDRGYVIGVSVNNDPDGMIWLEHFFDSFEIVVPEKKDDGKKPAEKKDN